jgi:hypothetical protein
MIAQDSSGDWPTNCLNNLVKCGTGKNTDVYMSDSDKCEKSRKVLEIPAKTVKPNS